MSKSELYHHGIPGMRWGIRRYQYEDGSLTPEGIIRYRKAKDEYDRVEAEKQHARMNGKVFGPFKQIKNKNTKYKYIYSFSNKKGEDTEWMTSQRYGEKSVPSEERFNEMVDKYADKKLNNFVKQQEEMEIEYGEMALPGLTPDILESVKKFFKDEGNKKLSELFPEYNKTPLSLRDDDGNEYKREEGGEWYTRKIKSNDPKVSEKTVTIDSGNRPVDKEAFDLAKQAEKLLCNSDFEEKLKKYIVDEERSFANKHGYQADEDYILSDHNVLDGARVVPSYEGNSIEFYYGWWSVEYDPKTKKFGRYSYDD